MPKNDVELSKKVKKKKRKNRRLISEYLTLFIFIVNLYIIYLLFKNMLDKKT